jgi:hypothetical protein
MSTPMTCEPAMQRAKAEMLPPTPQHGSTIKGELASKNLSNSMAMAHAESHGVTLKSPSMSVQMPLAKVGQYSNRRFQ